MANPPTYQRDYWTGVAGRWRAFVLFYQESRDASEQLHKSLKAEKKTRNTLGQHFTYRLMAEHALQQGDLPAARLT